MFHVLIETAGNGMRSLRYDTPRRGTWGALVCALLSVPLAAAENGPPPITNPRATSGDSAVEPNWAETLTVTVGPQGAQLTGSDDKILQAAVDYVARLGGGTVKVLPGTYRMRNSVFLASKVRILGSGADSVLLKESSAQTPLVANSDWYDQEVTLADPQLFRVGDGICLQSKNPHHGGRTVLKRTLIARSGNRFKLDRPLRENFWLSGTATASSLFPLISGENIADVVIENITLDGNKTRNAELDGNFGGCIFLQDCNRVTIRRVTARNNHGDGISWQIAHDVRVEECQSHDHTGLGLHPGSGSQRTVMRGNVVERNQIGIFFCWGVKFGLAEKNTLRDNVIGISIGHCDTHNLVRNNDILNSGRYGVLFRHEGNKDFLGHHNVIEGNRIENSGDERHGAGIALEGELRGVVLRKNRIVDTRTPGATAGIIITKSVGEVRLQENEIRGVAVPVRDERPAVPSRSASR